MQEDRYGVPADPQPPQDFSAERNELVMQLLNRHRLVHVLREVFGSTLSPRPKTISYQEQQDGSTPVHGGGRVDFNVSKLLEEARTTEYKPDVTRTESVPAPPASVVDNWLANNFRVQLEVPVLQYGGRVLGFMPLEVSWPDNMDGHWFDFECVAIDVAPKLTSNSDCLALIRRINLFREVSPKYRGYPPRFLVYTRPTEFKFLLEQQRITVYEVR